MAEQVREVGELGVDERLAGDLPGGVRERRDGEARLALGRVGGQATALAGGVDDERALPGDPVEEARAGGREGAPRLGKEVGGAAARAELAAGRVAAGERDRGKVLDAELRGGGGKGEERAHGRKRGVF